MFMSRCADRKRHPGHGRQRTASVRALASRVAAISAIVRDGEIILLVRLQARGAGASKRFHVVPRPG